MKYFILVSVALLLAACFGRQPKQHSTGLEGKKVPEFDLQLPDSTSFFSSTNIKSDKPFAIFYFSPYCPHCRAQTTEIIEDMDRLKDMRFIFVTAFPYSYMKKYYEEFQIEKYPNITMGVDTGRIIGKYFEVPGVPFTAVYSSNKTLNKSFIGKVYSNQLIKAVQQ